MSDRASELAAAAAMEEMLASRPPRDAGMDWEQVRQNGGPPCFAPEEDGRRCGRAQRWDGHQDRDDYPFHRYVSFERAIAAAHVAALERAAVLMSDLGMPRAARAIRALKGKP